MTASAPSPGSVLAPKMGVKWISSLSSVQVKSCLGASVGASPPSPPQPRIRPVRGSCRPRGASRHRMRWRRGRRRARLRRRPRRRLGEDEARAAVDGLADEVAFEHGDAGEVARRAVGLPITKYPPFTAARASVRAEMEVRSSRSGTNSVASSGSSVPV